MANAKFFTWLQSAPFYEQALTECVNQVPAGSGRWADVGCGPGLMSRLAARRGFLATGYDRSAEMVEAARLLSRGEARGVNYAEASLEALGAQGTTAEVVSAASLLTVLPDRRRALEQLWTLVAPGGVLLLVETTSSMRLAKAVTRRGKTPLGLLLWALVRGGNSAAADIEAFAPKGLASVRRHLALDGMLAAWLLERAPLSPTPLSPTPHRNGET